MVPLFLFNSTQNLGKIANRIGLKDWSAKVCDIRHHFFSPEFKHDEKENTVEKKGKTMNFVGLTCWPSLLLNSPSLTDY